MDNQVSIIINGSRYDASYEENYRSCEGCDIGKNVTTAGCLFSDLCRRRHLIFKKSDKKFEK